MGRNRKSQKLLTNVGIFKKNRFGGVLQGLTVKELTYGHSSGTIDKSEYVNGVLNGAFQFSSIAPVDQTIEISGNISIVGPILKVREQTAVFRPSKYWVYHDFSKARP